MGSILSAKSLIIGLKFSINWLVLFFCFTIHRINVPKVSRGGKKKIDDFSYYNRRVIEDKNNKSERGEPSNIVSISTNVFQIINVYDSHSSTRFIYKTLNVPLFYISPRLRIITISHQR